MLGNYYYNHTELNTLFLEHDAPGEPPEGNCVTKCTEWLKQCNEDPNVNALEVLAGVIEDYMEFEISEYDSSSWAEGRERLKRVLAKNSLSYLPGGTIVVAGTTPCARSLRETLSARDFAAVETEFQRALDSVEADPPAGITAACALTEALCKVYIEDEALDMPTKQSLKPLWNIVSKHIGFDPAEVADDDLKRILSGLTSVVDGLASLRTHIGSAHGRGRKIYRVDPRHARLAINSAHTLAHFVLETWEYRRNGAGG